MTSSAKPHQQKSATFGEAGKPIALNTSQKSWPTSHSPAAATHQVHWSRWPGSAPRRAPSVPASEAAAAEVNAAFHVHTGSVTCQAARSIATTASALSATTA